MIAATYAALRARLESDPDMVGRVFDSARKDRDGVLVRDMYVIVLSAAATNYDTGRYLGVADSSATATFDIDLRFVGRNTADVYALMDLCASLLQGHRLVVAGRVNDPMQIDGSTRVLPDRSVSPPLYYGDVSLTFISRPA